MAGNLTAEQRDVLIKTILGEAAGEGPKGMQAVAEVILNRAKSGEYPADPAKVAKQPYQFSTWNKGAGGNNPEKWKPGTKSYQTASEALDTAFGPDDPTGGSLMYNASDITPYWANEANVAGTKQIGNHVFYPNPRIASINDMMSTDGVPMPRPSPTSAAGIMDALNRTNSPGVPFASTQSSGAMSGMGADLGLASSPVNINGIPMPRPRPQMQGGIKPLGQSADLSLAANPVTSISGTYDPNFGLGMAPDVGAYQMPGDFTGGSILPPMPRPRPLGAPTGAPDPAGLLQQQYARENAGQNPGQLNQPVQPAMPSSFLNTLRQGYPGAPQLGVGSSVQDMYKGIIPQVMQSADNANGYPMGGGDQAGLVPNMGANGQVQSISPAPAVGDLYKGILPIQGQMGFAPTQQPAQNFVAQMFSGTVPPITPSQPAQVYNPTTFDPGDPMRNAVSGNIMPRPRPDSASQGSSIIPQIMRSGGYLYTPNPNGGYTKIGKDPTGAPSQSNGGNTSRPTLFGGGNNSGGGGTKPSVSNGGGGLKPGDRKYNPSTNRWELK